MLSRACGLLLSPKEYQPIDYDSREFSYRCIFYQILIPSSAANVDYFRRYFFSYLTTLMRLNNSYTDKRDGRVFRNDSRRGVCYRRRFVGIILKRRLGKTWKPDRYNNEDKRNVRIEITQWTGCMSVGFKIAVQTCVWALLTGLPVRRLTSVLFSSKWENDRTL